MNKEQKILLSWDTNWADEMDISGFVIISEEKAKTWKEKVKNFKEYFNLCVGTNEEIEYSNGKELYDEVNSRKITQEEASIIEKYLGNSYGYTEFYNQLDDLEGWEDEEDDDDDDNE